MYVIGVDLGTGSLKTVLADKNGRVLAKASAAYALKTPKPGYCEQNPLDWFRAFEETFIKVLDSVEDARDKVEGISFSGQMHGLVMLDKIGNVLRPAILWNDVRTTQECERIHKTVDIVKITKNKALEGFTLPKLLWVQKHEPEIFSQMETFLLPKDFLVYCLTDQMNTDYSDASGTLMLDFEKKAWSRTVFDAFDIPMSCAPKLVESQDCVGILKTDIKERFGLSVDVKVFQGGADNAVSALGAGIINEDTSLVSIGTSGVVLSYESNPPLSYNGSLHAFYHCIKDAYYSMGVTLSAGYSLSWFKHAFYPELEFDALIRDIDEIEVGSSGLLYTPYIMGERTPHTDAHVRGSFIGLDTSHTEKHFIRAVVEGITYSLKDVVTIMESHGKTLPKCVGVGGGAKSKSWIKIQANVFNTTMITLTEEEGPAFGAAMLAMLGLNWYKTAAECVDVCVSYASAQKPNSLDIETYQHYYDIYKDIYKQTASLTHRLTRLRR